MKNIISLITFSILLFLVSCKSSYTKIGDKNANYIPYYLKVYEADSLFIVGNYQRSYEILDSLFKKYEPVEIQEYREYSNYVFSAVLSGNTQNIKKKAKKGYIDNGGLNTSNVKVYPLLDSINQVIGFSDKEITKFKEKYNSNINLKLRELINKMSIDDQAIRGENFKSTEELEELSRVHEKMITEIFDKYGYPSSKKIGFEDDLRTVFAHTDPIEFKPNYLLPKLLKYVKRGEEQPDVYANTYDKWQYTLSGGEKLYFHPQTNQFNSKQLDSVRNSIGLPHKNYQKWKMDKITKEIEELTKKATN
ncbi:MAG: hypothetical protein AB7D46_08560 [Flavobacteriaceae bacterium]